MTEHFHDRKLFADWLSSRFENKQSVCVGIDLLACRVHQGSQEWISRETIEQTARRFRNKLNHAFYGKAARRFDKGLTMTIHLHDTPHKHFHCVIEIPEGVSFIKLKSVVENICLNDAWMKPFPNFSETRNVVAAQTYNGRFGTDTLVLF